MEMTKGTKYTIALGSVCFAWYIFMLVFRVFIYDDMYIAPEDPYGISDILEFFMGIAFLALLSISIITSVFLLFHGMSQTKKFAAGLIVFCMFLFFSFSPLHNIAAGWGH